MVGAANDLNISQAGYVVFDGVSVFSGRTFQQGTGILITNASGVAGNSTISINNSLVGQTITGNTGGARPPTSGNWNIVTANSIPKFVGAASTLTLDFALTNNLLLGSSGAITSGQFNVGVGQLSQSSNQSANANVSIGYGSLQSVVSGGGNTAIGHLSLTACTNSNNTCVGLQSLTSCIGGANNVALGYQSGSGITSGNRNIFIGFTTGLNYTSSESNNILIGNTGILSESNTLRIGTQGSGVGQQNRAFVSGIVGVTVSNEVPVTIDSTTGQLGVGTPVSPGIATINGDSGSVTGTTVTIYTNHAAVGSGSSVLFTNSSTTSTLSVTDASNNTIIGSGAGNLTLTGANNAGLGALVLAALTDGNSNVAMGSTSLATMQSGSNNIAIGTVAIQNATAGDSNIGIGAASLQNLGTGSANIAIGTVAGQSLTTTDSNNILIGNAGVSGDNSRIRIGTNGTHSTCFVQGISGVTVTGTAVLCATDGQLGTIASSERYKENIRPISDDVSILNLKPMKFNYKSDEEKHVNYGLIAEDVEEEFPYLCFYKEGLLESVKYHELPTLLLLEIQRLVKRIEILEGKNAAS